MNKRPSDHTARAIRLRRDQLGWSAKRLADECARLGAPELTSAVIANIEHGRPDEDGRRRRDVTVDELLVLAYALAVPPLLLLVPLGDEDETPILPGLSVPPAFAWRWINGDEPPAVRGEDGQLYAARPHLHDWQGTAQPLRLYRALGEAFQQAETARLAADGVEQQIAYVGRGSEALDDLLAFHREQYVKALSEVAVWLGRMVDGGVRPPLLHGEIAADMRAAGVKLPEGVRAQAETADSRG